MTFAENKFAIDEYAEDSYEWAYNLVLLVDQRKLVDCGENVEFLNGNYVYFYKNEYLCVKKFYYTTFIVVVIVINIIII